MRHARYRDGSAKILIAIDRQRKAVTKTGATLASGRASETSPPYMTNIRISVAFHTA